MGSKQNGSVYLYIGCFFAEEEWKQILDRMPGARLARGVAHPHVTFCYRPETVDESLFGERIRVQVTGYGCDGRNEGLRVKLSAKNKVLQEMICGIPVPHITVSLAENAEAKDTGGLAFQPSEVKDTGEPAFQPAEPWEAEGIFGGLQVSGRLILSGRDLPGAFAVGDTIQAAHSRYVVPFFWNTEKTSYPEAVRYLRTEAPARKWECRGIRRGEQDLYDYILDSMEEDAEDLSNIGSAWLMKRDRNQHRKLPRLQFVSIWGEQYPAMIENMGLYLFQTGIGLFWYDMKCMIPEVSEWMRFQNVAKELSARIYETREDAKKRKTSYLLRDNTIPNGGDPRNVKCAGNAEDTGNAAGTGNAEDSGNAAGTGNTEGAGKTAGAGKTDAGSERRTDAGFDGLCIGEWVLAQVREAVPGAEFFATRRAGRRSGAAIVPDKALLYQYVLIRPSAQVSRKDWDEHLEEVTFCLTRGENGDKVSGHLPSIRGEMYHPFDERVIYAARGGCGQFVLCDDDNDEFLRVGLINRWLTNYFPLYMILLHQSYSLLYFTEQMERLLPASMEPYRKGDEEILKMLDRFRLRFNTFLIKDIYASVAHLENYDRFYRYVQKQLRIEEDIRGLQLGLETVAEMEHLIRERQEKEERERRERRRKEKEEAERAEKEREEKRRLKQEEAEKAAGRRTDSLLALISILAIASILQDGSTVIDRLLGRSDARMTDWHWLFAGVVVVGILVFVIWNHFRSRPPE